MKKYAELTVDELSEISGGVCVTKSGTEYYKADSKYIYYRHQGQEHKVEIRRLQCMLGRSCEEMNNFINKINDDEVYGPSK